MRRKVKGLININPLQTGGILTEEARKALLEWCDGYSICDFCKGRLEEIENPPIKRFVEEELPNFVNADIVRITHGAREGMFAIMHAICEKGSYVIVDANAHYSTYISAERCGVEIAKTGNSGYPEYKIIESDYANLIEELKKKGKKVSLLVLTYPDGNYGNLPSVEKVVKIAREHDLPVLLNCAYSVGRMPIDMKKLGVDFIVASGHKSMAACGPIGFIAMRREFANVIAKKSKYFPRKEVEFLGCTVRGAPLITLMASFSHVKERVKHWDEQVEKARWFSREMEKLGIKQLGEKPHSHDLMQFESEELFKISQKHKRRGYFLYHELKKRGIWGIKPGLTKRFKLSTYAASKEELKIVIDAFRDILQAYKA